MNCQNCGTENDERAQFCQGCGQALPRGEGPEAEAPSTRPSARKPILVGLGIAGGIALIIAAIVVGWILLDGAGDTPRAEEAAPPGMFSTLPTTEAPLVGDQPGVKLNLQGTPAPTPTALPIATAVSTPEPTTGPTNQFTLPEKPALKYPKVGSTLDRLIARVEAGEASAADAAREAPLHRGEAVAVTIHLSGNVDGVVRFLEANGVSPRNVGEDYIEAYVPLALLGQTSEQSGVLRVQIIFPLELSRSTARIAGNGPQAHGSAAWNEAGYTGKGIKVGIIDGGFTGFSGLMGSELPQSVQASCRPSGSDRRSGELQFCEHTTNHGTAVAESVMDIAPEVSLYIANVQSKGDLQAATDWMIEQGVDVINLSGSFRFDGPGDGTSRHSYSPLKAVDRAVGKRIVWVNSAGNYAGQTWFGTPSDSDGDKIVEFTPGDETNTVRFDGAVKVELRWQDDWGGATRDLAFILCDRPCTSDSLRKSRIVNEDQSEAAEGDPIEYFSGRRMPSNSYDLVVINFSQSRPEWVQLMVKGQRISLEHSTSRSSIGNPAESANPGMLTVGAAQWESAAKGIRYYSSRGPAPDGRIKPDLVGADCGDTAVRNSNFCGTSQAAPHVAGLAALVRQRFPEYSPAQVVTYLKNNAEQSASPDPNNTWGHGFIKLPPLAASEPTPPPVPTATPTSVPTATPPPVPTAIPTSVPAATSPPVPTAIPTSVPAATPPLVPTAIPTSVPAATPPPVPTAIPTSVPAATPPPVPTAIPTSVPVPTPPPVPTAFPTSVPAATPPPVLTASPTSVPVPTPPPVPTAILTSVPAATPPPVPTAFPTSVPVPTPPPVPTAIPTSVPAATSPPIPAAIPTSVPVPTPPPVPTAIPTTGPNVPNAPANVRYVYEGATIRVSWEPVSGAAYYKVYYDDFHKSGCRLGRNGQPSFCDELAAQVTATTYVHPSPDAQNNYYWVTACNSGGCSAIDSANPAPAPTPPNAPSNVRYVREGATIRVSWEPVSGAAYYKVYYDDFHKSGCRLGRNGQPSFCDELAAQVTATTYVHPSPDAQNNYYWVTACGSGGCSAIDSTNPAALIDTGPTTPPAPSAPTSVPAATPPPVPTAIPATGPNVPNAPSNVRYVYEGATIRVSWEPVSGAAYYKVYYDDFHKSGCRLGRNGQPSFCDELAAQVTATTYVHPSPDAQNNYYWVTACNSGGCSAIDSANPAPAPTPPNAPSNVRYVREGATIRVSWEPVSGAAYYKVYYDDFHKSGCRLGRNGQPSFCDELAAQVTATTYVHPSPDAQNNYYWVTACGSGGCSAIDSTNPAGAAG